MNIEEGFCEEYSVYTPEESIISCLNNQRSVAKLCDVTLVAENEYFPAHRCVLAAASEYFSSMFEHDNFSESKTKQIKLQSLDKDALKEILDMIYTGTLHVSLDSMHSLLTGADHLLLSKAKFFCVDFMRKVIASCHAATEALQIRHTADMFSLPDLKYQAELVIASNFQHVVSSKDFLLLEFDSLIELIQSDCILEQDEFIFFEACIEWVKHDLEKRGRHFESLMHVVRMPLIDSYHLVSIVKKNDLVMQSTVVSALVQDAMEYQLLATTQSLNQSSRTKPRCNRANTLIYCLAGTDNFKCYVPTHDRWYSLSAPPVHEQDIRGGSKLHIGLTSVTGLVYASIQTANEQEVGNFTTRAVLMYNIDSNSWTSCNKPIDTGSQCVFLECSNVLYACSRTVIQKYKQETDEWVKLASTNLDPCQFAVSYDNCLYFYNLEDGVSQQVRLDKDFKVVKQQIMTPNRFIAEVLGIAKLCNHEIFISQRTITGTTRRIFNVKTNLWRDCCISYGLATLQPKAGVNYPLCFDPSDQWEAVSMREDSTLYMLSTKSGISDIPCKSKTHDLRKLDGVLPFCKLNLNTRMWTRLASLPERFAIESIQLCVSDGNTVSAPASVL